MNIKFFTKIVAKDLGWIIFLILLGVPILLLLVINIYLVATNTFGELVELTQANALITSIIPLYPYLLLVSVVLCTPVYIWRALRRKADQVNVK